MVFALNQFLNALIEIYLWVIIINAVLSWLIAFGVINTYTRGVNMVVNATYQLTEPVLAPIRRVLPPMGGLDLSPLILFLAVQYLAKALLAEVFRHLL